MVWIDGGRAKDVTRHPSFRPIVGVRARIYDLAHEDATRDVMSHVEPESNERDCIGDACRLGSGQDILML